MALQTHTIEGFHTQGGATLDLQLVSSTYGTLSEAKDNAILVLTSYSGNHQDAEALFAASDLLDLSGYCVIVVNMLCNGQSSSPSNTSAPFDGPRFPDMTVHDNVRCQHKVITENTHA